MHAKGSSEESERWLRAVVQNSSDIVMILETDAVVRYVSPAVERVLGYRPEDFVGTIALDYVHPDDLGTCRSRSPRPWENPLSTKR